MYLALSRIWNKTIEWPRSKQDGLTVFFKYLSGTFAFLVCILCYETST
jgi:hypothetical protein